MRSIPAREIKRRGISAVDDLLKEGPVYVIKNDVPRYVILDQKRYQDLIDDLDQITIEGVQASLEEVRAGLTREVTAEQLIAEFGLED